MKREIVGIGPIKKYFKPETTIDLTALFVVYSIYCRSHLVVLLLPFSRALLTTRVIAFGANKLPTVPEMNIPTVSYLRTLLMVILES